MRICIFGAGAVGSHFAVRLALAGHDVACVMRGPHLHAVKAGGLALRVGDVELRANVQASDDPDALGRVVQAAKPAVVWIETPSNPMLDVVDIARAAEVAHAARALLAVDSTAATPVLTRPLALGADLVMHSATKYLNGHSDVVAGALVTKQKDDRWAAIRGDRAESRAIRAEGNFRVGLIHARLGASTEAIAAYRRARDLYQGLVDESPGEESYRNDLASTRNTLVRQLEPRGVIVVLECEHMCMAMRGIQKAGARTITSAVRGLFQRDAKSRAEAMNLIVAPRR